MALAMKRRTPGAVTPGPKASDDRAALLQKLDEFIFWSIIGALGADPPLILVGIFVRHIAFAFIPLTLMQALVLLWARGEARREHLDAACAGIGIGMWVIAASLVFLMPELYPIVLLLSLWPVIVSLPYIGGRFLLRFIILCAVVELVMGALSLRADPYPLGLPLWLLHLASALVVPLLTTLISILIWQYSSRLTETLTGMRLANAALRESERLLESRVIERTAELATANEQIQQLNVRLQAENMRMSAELEVTQRLQRMVLPRLAELTEVPTLEIAAYMQPAAEVGGDYYDVLRLADGTTKIGIGDVTGHGLESGVLMLMVQTAVRTLQEAGERDPIRFLDIVNRTVWQNVQRMDSDRNLSLSLLDYRDGTVRLSGQHETLLLARVGQPLQMVDTMELGFPVGLVEDIHDFVSHTDLALGPGDVVVLYTDGIVEAENVAGNQYGLERLCQVVDEQRATTSEAIKDTILADLMAFIAGHEIFDDITLVVIKQR